MNHKLRSINRHYLPEGCQGNRPGTLWVLPLVGGAGYPLGAEAPREGEGAEHPAKR
jgi:hypothetical protein